MKRVRLIVTGDLERIALGASLQRYFPELDFVPPVQLHSMTSSRVPALSPGAPPPAQVRRVASAVAAEVFDRGRDSAEAVFVVDDLELVNMGRAHVVLEWLRMALRMELEERRSTHQPLPLLQEILRERAAVHFLVPMVEAYFFADRDALAAAGLPPEARPDLEGDDVERFAVRDAEYVAWADDQNARREKAGRFPRDLLGHPKDYLHFLAVKRAGRGYIETRDGVAALKALDWKQVCTHPDAGGHVRGLFADLAALAGVPSPMAEGAMPPEAWARDTLEPGQRLLRNV